jgi:hypothetical protein
MKRLKNISTTHLSFLEFDDDQQPLHILHFF